MPARSEKRRVSSNSTGRTDYKVHVHSTCKKNFNFKKRGTNSVDLHSPAVTPFAERSGGGGLPTEPVYRERQHTESCFDPGRMNVVYADARVPSPAGGTIRVRSWLPAEHGDDHVPADRRPVFVTVHPWAVLGGGEHNTIGVAQFLAARHGSIALTFKLRSSGMVWGTFSNQRSEVRQITAVLDWAAERYDGRPLILLGSSAGAPMAGACIEHPSVSALVVVGYTFGKLSSIAFGRLFKHITGRVSSEKAKLFIMGEHDEFTSVSQLQSAVRGSRGSSNYATIVPRVGHFELESPDYDEWVAQHIFEHAERLGIQPRDAVAVAGVPGGGGGGGGGGEGGGGGGGGGDSDGGNQKGDAGNDGGGDRKRRGNDSDGNAATGVQNRAAESKM